MRGDGELIRILAFGEKLGAEPKSSDSDLVEVATLMVTHRHILEVGKESLKVKNRPKKTV